MNFRLNLFNAKGRNRDEHTYEGLCFEALSPASGGLVRTGLFRTSKRKHLFDNGWKSHKIGLIFIGVKCHGGVVWVVETQLTTHQSNLNYR